MPDGLRTFENLDDDKRERVLDAALDEFAVHGFHGASVNRMVQRLGIAKGSLFKYFGTKEGMFAYLHHRCLKRFSAPLKVIRAEREADFFERFARSLVAGAEFLRAHPRIYQIYLKLQYQENAPLREQLLGELNAKSAKFVRGLVDDAVAAGQFREDVDAAFAADFLESVLERFLQSLALTRPGGRDLTSASPEAVQAHVDHLITLLRRGLGRPDDGDAAC